MSRAVTLGVLAAGAGVLLLLVALMSSPGPTPVAEPAPVSSAAGEPERTALERPVGERGERPPAPPPRAAETSTTPRVVESPPPPGGNPALAGLSLGTADSDQLQRAGVPAGETGLVVMAVDPASAAAEAQLEAGDVITKAQREKLDSEAALARAVGNRGFTVLTVYRKGQGFHTVLHKPFSAEPK